MKNQSNKNIRLIERLETLKTIHSENSIAVKSITEQIQKLKMLN